MSRENRESPSSSRRRPEYSWVWSFELDNGEMFVTSFCRHFLACSSRHLHVLLLVERFLHRLLCQVLVEDIRFASLRRAKRMIGHVIYLERSIVIIG